MEKIDSLKGKMAIVTGAGRGIGRAIARRLSVAGANVVLASRTTEQLEETQRLIDRAGGLALAVPADVTRAEDIERIVDSAMGTYSRIDILVNNAGTAPLAPITEMEPPAFDRILATNIRSVYLCSRAVWPIMADAGGGVIVNISSVAAFDPFPGFAAYGAAKAFVNTYTKALAQEGKPVGIRVYGVAPGAVDTHMLRGAFPDFPPEKMLQPDDVASLVETLLLPGCRHISGQTLVIQKS